MVNELFADKPMLATIISGRKNVTQFSVNQKFVNTSAKIFVVYFAENFIRRKIPKHSSKILTEIHDIND